MSDKPYYSNKKNSSGWEWSEKEIEILQKSAGINTIDEISGILGRPKRSIINKASCLKIIISDKKKWTSDDDRSLEQYAGKLSIEEISKKLNRSIISIKSRASKLNLSLALRNNRWTLKEKEKLKALCGNYSVDEIADILKRSKSSIQTMASSLGLSLNILRNKWSEDEVKTLISLNGSTKEYASTVLTNKSSESITAKAKTLNIEFIPMKENFIVKKDNKILNDTNTLYSLHKKLKDKGFPVGKYQANWLKSDTLKNLIDINKLEKVDIYLNNGASNSKKHHTWILSGQDQNIIESHYINLKRNITKPVDGYRCYDLYKYLKNKKLIKSSYYSSFIKSDFLQNFIYEENIRKIEYTYIIEKGKWAKVNGFYFSQREAENYIQVLNEYKNRKKHPGSFALRSLQRRIKEKYGEHSLDHLHSKGEKSMVYMIENASMRNNFTSDPKRYIGIWKSTNSDNYICSGILVYQDILKYGPEHFSKKVLFTSTNYEEIKKMETTYILKYKTNQKQREGEGHWGYNQTDGGDTVTFSTPVLIYDYKNNEKIYFPSMAEAEDVLSLSKGSLSGHISRNKLNEGTPYLLKNKYICMYQNEEDLFDSKIKELRNKGRLDVVEPVLEICPFTMMIKNHYGNSNSASIALTGSSKIGGDIRLLCKGETNAMVKNSYWIFEKDKNKLEDKFHSFHSSRKQKMVKRTNVKTNEISYFYNGKEAARSIKSNGHMIRNLIENKKIFNGIYKFEYIEKRKTI